MTDGGQATATVIGHLLNEFGLESVLGRYSGFINVDETMIMSDAIELLPQKQVVLEVLETVDLTAPLPSRIDQLRERGFAVALDDFAGMPNGRHGLLEHFDVVKIDVQQVGMASLPALVGNLESTEALRWANGLMA